MPVQVILATRVQDEGRFAKGIGETHYFLGSPDELESINSQLLDMANARIAMNAGNTVTIEVRASRPGLPKDSYRIFTARTGDRGSALSISGGFKQFNADQSNSCLQILMAQSDYQKRNLFMAGLPDDLLRTNPPGPHYDDVPGWLEAFKVWAALLVNGDWGFKSRVINTPADMKAIHQWNVEAAAPFRLILSVDEGDGFMDVGDEIQVRGVTTYNQGQAKPLGKFDVAATSVGAGLKNVTLRGAVGFDPTQFDDLGSVEPVEYEYVAYKSIKPVGQTTRKRGVGPVRPRGRSRARRR